MKPALYIVEAPPHVIAHFERVCEKTRLPFKVRRTETSLSSNPDADGAGDVSVAPLLLRQSRGAEVLDVSESTLARLVRSGQLPAVRLGGATRVRGADLEEFVQRLGDDRFLEGQCLPDEARVDGARLRSAAGEKE